MNTLYGIIGVLLAIGLIVWPLAWWHGTKHPQPRAPEPLRIAESVTLEKLPGGGHNLLIDGEPLPWHVEPGPTIEQWEDFDDLYIVRIGIIVDVS